jgi:hypothetical protein
VSTISNKNIFIYNEGILNKNAFKSLEEELEEMKLFESKCKYLFFKINIEKL